MARDDDLDLDCVRIKNEPGGNWLESIGSELMTEVRSESSQASMMLHLGAIFQRECRNTDNPIDKNMETMIADAVNIYPTHLG